MSFGQLKGTLEDYSRRLSQELQKFLRKHDGSATLVLPTPLLKIKEDDGVFNVTVLPWRFLRCPSGHARKDKCDIYLEGRFTCQFIGQEKTLLDYGTHIVWVTYPTPEENVQKPTDAYHFDMDLKHRANHPIFHAQRNLKIAHNFGLELADEVDNGLRTLRLPTAQLDFFSTIALVFADHFVSSEESKVAFAELRERVTDNNPLKVPSRDLGNLMCCPASRVHAGHWYSPGLA